MSNRVVNVNVIKLTYIFLYEQNLIGGCWHHLGLLVRRWLQPWIWIAQANGKIHSFRIIECRHWWNQELLQRRSIGKLLQNLLYYWRLSIYSLISSGGKSIKSPQSSFSMKTRHSQASTCVICSINKTDLNTLRMSSTTFSPCTRTAKSSPSSTQFGHLKM